MNSSDSKSRMGEMNGGQSSAEARIQARYWIETAFPLEDAAAIMAGEQSTGTFIKVPGETAELRERFAAQVSLAQHPLLVDEPSRRDGIDAEAAAD